MFGATLLSVYWTYGMSWTQAGWLEPFTNPVVAWDCFQFAAGLMSIFLAHEMGHYLVARRHGMDQTLPLFIPFPLAFGTLGAIIRLKSLPPNRSALLEMGAAGPLAGFVVALLVMAIGLPQTVEQVAPQLRVMWPPPPPSDFVLAIEPAFAVLDQILGVFWTPEPPPTIPTIPLGIMANPPVMSLMGAAILGEAPSRYAELSPLGLASWAGCFLTAMNMLPIGQLDGGHVTNALAPRYAKRLSLMVLGTVMVVGLFTWPGWTFWGVVLMALGAFRSLPVHSRPPLTTRAKLVAASAGVAFVACFMPVPLEVEEIPIDQIELQDLDGRAISMDEYRAWQAEIEAGKADE